MPDSYRDSEGWKPYTGGEGYSPPGEVPHATGGGGGSVYGCACLVITLVLMALLLTRTPSDFEFGFFYNIGVLPTYPGENAAIRLANQQLHVQLAELLIAWAVVIGIPSVLLFLRTIKEAFF
ncbi:MAG: hypothetical protein ABSH49_29220 [Bryobacteraceae bacterium]|jgi:hypothetical protein